MNIFTQFVKSLYSPKDMATFRFQGIGKTILYVFFIMLISIIPFSYHFTMMVNQGVKAMKDTTNEIPAFTIKNGILSSEQNETKILSKDGMKIVFDPTGNITAEDIEKEKDAIGILKDEFIISSNGNVETLQYSMVEGLNLSKQKLNSYLNALDSSLGIFLPIIIFLSYLFVSAMGFIKITIFASLALLIRQGRKLSYKQSFRITAYCITLPTVIFTLFSLFKIAIPFGFLINWALIILMLYLTIQAMPIPKKKQSNIEPSVK
ncbi:hypothetical protein J2S13_000280 [Oikeobacillus pervagus]|uniref:DUF1189 domain-containing protein n=1 Tax=Oikeobacillus pervagus TaxID=1325931 RepID=A0AAJ1WJ88_9BACI|nr:DUF1189 domain-containing protein [Oikeobacillus pervagus]MDQ0213886.1 hypothetical protein [Oikeobacillus pervagus]